MRSKTPCKWERAGNLPGCRYTHSIWRRYNQHKQNSTSLQDKPLESTKNPCTNKRTFYVYIIKQYQPLTLSEYKMWRQRWFALKTPHWGAFFTYLYIYIYIFNLVSRINTRSTPQEMAERRTKMRAHNHHPSSLPVMPFQAFRKREPIQLHTSLKAQTKMSDKKGVKEFFRWIWIVGDDWNRGVGFL